MLARGSLFRRHPRNPIITAADLAYPANTVFNPGAAAVNGETVLLIRVEDLGNRFELWEPAPQALNAPFDRNLLTRRLSARA